MIKMKSFLAVSLLVAGASCNMAIAGHTNPIDPVSNPKSQDFSDVSVNYRDLPVKFVRNGVVSDAQGFQAIQVGMPQNAVQSLLGVPLSSRADGKNDAWDYHFTFKMPESNNILICQYRVTFDQNDNVLNTVWRRRQCENIASPRG